MFPTELQVENYLTRAQYKLVPIHLAPRTQECLRELVQICNEPAIYNILFREKLVEQPYSLFDAERFFTWGTLGWMQGRYFIYLALTAEGAPAAAIDIKSANKDLAEVGYWSSSRHRGIMTNMLSHIVNIASAEGYLSLFARVRKINLSSIKVLNNNLFTRDDSWQAEPIRYRYVRTLVK